MAEKKITKMEYFAMIESALLKKREFSDAEIDELVDFVQKQMEQIEHKAAKAKERAEEKKTETDALYDAVGQTLTNEFQNVNTIVENLVYDGEDDVTRQKVVSRLTKLVKNGVAEKETQKKVMCYRLAERKTHD